MSRENRNYIILAGVLVVFVAVVVNEFVLSSDSSSGATRTDRAIATTTTGQRVNGSTGQRVNGSTGPLSHLPIDPLTQSGYHPLPLQVLQAKSALSEPPERDPFGYYVPPPKPPKPVTPPPLAIGSVDPTLVYAGTKDFTLRVSGRELPEDARIFINGQPLPTTRVSDSALSASVGKRLIAAPGRLQVEVKNASGELYSNPLTVNVQPPPTPSYKYIGRIDNVVFLEKGENKRLEARLGETVENRWRVAEVGGGKVVLEDVAIGVQHTLALPERAPRVVVRQATGFNQRRYQRPVRRPPQRVVGQQGFPNQNPPPNPNPVSKKKPGTQ